MKFRKSNFIAQSRALSKNEILDLVTGLRSDPRWRSRSKRPENDVHSFYYPRLVDLRYLDLGDDYLLFCGGLLGLELDQVNLDQWDPKFGKSELAVGGIGFCSEKDLMLSLGDGGEMSFAFGFSHTGNWWVRCTDFDCFTDNDDKRILFLQKLIDAAGYSGLLEVTGLVNSHYSKKAKIFFVRSRDPKTSVVYRSANFAEEVPKLGPYVRLGLFSIEDCEKYGELNANDFPGRMIEIAGLSFGQAKAILNSWRLLFFGNDKAVVCRAHFFARSASDWISAKNWLSSRMSGPWVFSNLFSHRSLVEDLTETFEKTEARDCLVPLGYWKTKAGSTVLLDAVSNGDDQWEIWVHCKKALGNKVVDSIRQELSTESLFSGFFDESREFKWGGSCDFIINI